ncbi:MULTISPECIES: sulfurtransferase-like selenium metabolism protein YedF [Clostridium]|uniref:Sulfurtransferase-like selenium metabolism protein YedF n=1 Tax=Clostridium aquiflavi TaxID=3073603 RepID=A0ABU1EHK7_9CLOT|nr:MULTISPECIES: sulfurtransferase-like selenium metabolism protein YedF [unclassified Clostridium]MDR5587759.1 sulfurtransferase-like selenium metabolism protein YedF [Clostridium sp. 5N-1]NFG62409.1 sulfurtransferase-like selenium metabolism protein YedF [Clostridium botulinum]NFQ09073.1 sulfurtransferase-like selenium metabolism protein YedF [Clostridium botulinum]
MKEIDCRGLSFPKTIRMVKKYFNSIGEGEAIVIIEKQSDNSNIVNFAMNLGYHVDVEENDENVQVFIEKRGCLEAIDETVFSVLITSDKFGTGDSKLGKILLNDYLNALSDAIKLPKNIIFLNEGVKVFEELPENTGWLENIKLLYQEGVSVFVHDKSLEYYKLNISNNFSEIIDMIDIVDIINESNNLVKL